MAWKGAEIEHAAQPRDDRGQLRELGESNLGAERVPMVRPHRDRAVQAVDLDRPPVFVARHDLETLDGTRLEERQHAGPVVWRPIPQQDGDHTGAGRVGSGGAAQPVRRPSAQRAEHPLKRRMLPKPDAIAMSIIESRVS